ncbi:PREDICTED: GMP reductase 1-like, partial [Phaethon lepturus]|uniref:GMP reductase 1-like n=1 Tax=Phaethon lepturus TaxID=97097 RepID=UPI0005308058
MISSIDWFPHEEKTRHTRVIQYGEEAAVEDILEVHEVKSGMEKVDLTRTFTFRNSKQTYTGIPIIVANMDTVGTFEMAVVMAKHAMFTAIHKHYSLEEWKMFAANHPECLEHVAASSGSGKADLDKLTSILEAIPPIRYICLDVANGYSEHFVEFVKSVRALFPHHTIM